MAAVPITSHASGCNITGFPVNIAGTYSFNLAAPPVDSEPFVRVYLREADGTAITDVTVTPLSGGGWVAPFQNPANNWYGMNRKFTAHLVDGSGTEVADSAISGVTIDRNSVIFERQAAPKEQLKVGEVAALGVKSTMLAAAEIISRRFTFVRNMPDLTFCEIWGLFIDHDTGEMLSAPTKAVINFDAPEFTIDFNLRRALRRHGFIRLLLLRTSGVIQVHDIVEPVYYVRN